MNQAAFDAVDDIFQGKSSAEEIVLFSSPRSTIEKGTPRHLTREIPHWGLNFSSYSQIQLIRADDSAALQAKARREG
jgi:hypothetical protein